MRPMPIANRYDGTKVRKSKDLCKRLIRILMCWEGREKEITFVEETIDNGPDSSFSVWKQ